MSRNWHLLIALAVLAMIVWANGVSAQGPVRAPRAVMGTAFTYQGQLKSGGAAYTGICDFQFSLYDALTVGTQIGSTQPASNVSVSNGYFTSQIDFGANAFTGDARWLAISVRCPAGSGSYTALNPRQALTPAPYALALPGLYTQQNATSPNLIGGYNGNTVTSGVAGATISGGGTSTLANRVTDDYGTVGGGHNNQAGDNAGTIADKQDATVGGGYTNTSSGSRATIGGGYNNTASNTNTTIGGGSSNTASGMHAIVSGGYNNTASANSATVSGGNTNIASNSSATVSGGQSNTASNTFTTIGGGNANKASGSAATVGGGDTNTASNLSATVSGGYNNTASNQNATVGGGNSNNASGLNSTVGGGFSNITNNTDTTVGGGASNTASGPSGTVGGGSNNKASGLSAVVPGGASNVAQGSYSFAAGRRAKANHDGAFVWGDSTDADVASTGNDQFVIRAAGGMRIPGAGVGANTFVFIHKATAPVGNTTCIDHPLANSDPNAILIVTQNYNPGGVVGGYNNNQIGVWYNGASSKWCIFNESLAMMPTGTYFNVLVFKP